MRAHRRWVWLLVGVGAVAGLLLGIPTDPPSSRGPSAGGAESLTRVHATPLQASTGPSLGQPAGAHRKPADRAPAPPAAPNADDEDLDALHGGAFKEVKVGRDYRRVKVGPWTERYAMGARSGRGRYVDGRRVGPWTYWYPSGALSVKVTYDEHGAYDGLYESFHEDGTRSARIVYQAGAVEGVLRRWYRDGKPSQELPHRKGKLHGECRTWHRNGVLWTRGSSVDGVADGTWTTWDERGTRRREERWLRGERVGDVLTWDAQGNRVGVRDRARSEQRPAVR